MGSMCTSASSSLLSSPHGEDGLPLNECDVVKIGLGDDGELAPKSRLRGEDDPDPDVVLASAGAPLFFRTSVRNRT